MSKLGFISIPRSLETDCCWVKYSLRERALFLHILFSCVYSPYEYNIAGKRLILQPGQMMTTIRDLTESYNNTVCHKEDKLTKSTIYRILERFARDQKLGHQVVQNAGQSETLITIVDLDIYNITFNFSGTGSGTGSGTDAGQVRDNIKRTREQEQQVIVVSAQENARPEQEKINMQDEEKFKEKIFAKSKLLNGKLISASVEDLKKELKSDGFSKDEIEQGIEILRKNTREINTNIKNYLSGIIIKQREKPWKEKKMKEPLKKQENSKIACEKDSGFYSENGTSESPLAIYARQIGLS